MLASDLFNQSEQRSRQKVLRGAITPERAWWDLSHYHLDIKVDPANKYISGTNTMKYRVLSKQKRLQIELQPPMKLTKVVQNDQALTIEQDGYSYFISLYVYFSDNWNFNVS